MLYNFFQALKIISQTELVFTRHCYEKTFFKIKTQIPKVSIELKLWKFIVTLVCITFNAETGFTILG